MPEDGLYYSAVRLVASDATSWWLTVSPLGVLDISPTVPPEGPLIALSGGLRWFALTSPGGALWYIAVAPVGAIESTTAQPLGNGEPRAIRLWDSVGVPWGLRISDLGILEAVLLAQTFDAAGGQELLAGVTTESIRFAWQDRLPHEPDGRIYYGAGRLSPASGTPMIGYLQRFRDSDPLPDYSLSDWFGVDC